MKNAILLTNVKIYIYDDKLCSFDATAVILFMDNYLH